MERISICDFKVTCHAVPERVHRTKQRVLITRFGRILAEVLPSCPPRRQKICIGSMQGTAQIVGDIVSPVSNQRDWEADR